MTKSDIAEIKKSQNFLSEKFDNIVKSIDALKRENNYLRCKNTELVTRISERESKKNRCRKG